MNRTEPALGSKSQLGRPLEVRTAQFAQASRWAAKLYETFVRTLPPAFAVDFAQSPIQLVMKPLSVRSGGHIKKTS
jgi:hypothetical protein